MGQNSSADWVLCSFAWFCAPHVFITKPYQHCRAWVKVTQNGHINITIQIIANCLSLCTDFKRLYAEISLSQFAECCLQTNMRLKTAADGLVALSAVHRCF